MLSIKYIQENKKEVMARLQIKNFEAEAIIKEAIATDNNRRATQQKLDTCQSELNSLSKEIGNLFKSGKVQEANSAKQKTTELKEEIKNLTQELSEYEKQLHNILIRIPNLPNPWINSGKGAEDNVLIRSGGNIPCLDDKSLPHWELAKKYDIIDFELGTKITGSGFPVYKGQGAKLERGLINFFLDEAIKAGYKEVIPPLMVNEDSAFGTGQLPDKDEQMYFVGSDNFYLIPTSEVPVTNIYRDTILNASELPVKNTSYTPCFRREAGSYGKDVRGLNRIHQFDKVEIVRIELPENSYSALEEMVVHVENLVKKLELPYRIMRLCGADMSFTSAMTYDFEVFSAAEKKWLEVSSVSNFESFQANRLKLRYRDENDKKIKLAHTLNGSALALPRIVAALLENNQTADCIIIPAALRSQTGFDKIIC
ncbi:MAG: serine--tRNA ligase [Bacteroidia bacterium]|nr:serine--tRNA ligase [Bacteroidia bacterium]